MPVAGLLYLWLKQKTSGNVKSYEYGRFLQFFLLYLRCGLKDKANVEIEILNPEYTKPPDEDDNIEINEKSKLEEIFKKIDYYYATRDFDASIALCESVLKNTKDEKLKAAMHYSLSAS